LFVIDAEKCFGPPPGETILQNGDSTAKGVLYPAGYISEAVTMLNFFHRKGNEEEIHSKL
jgi:hypothetical protein